MADGAQPLCAHCQALQAHTVAMDSYNKGLEARNESLRLQNNLLKTEIDMMGEQITFMRSRGNKALATQGAIFNILTAVVLWHGLITQDQIDGLMAPLVQEQLDAMQEVLLRSGVLSPKQSQRGS